MKKMKVFEYNQYGGPEVLKIKETEVPIPGKGEILIRLHATSVTRTEAYFRQGKPYATRLFTGLLKPKLKRLGEEISGTIMKLGEKVSEFKVGEEIFGTAGPDFGANAEYFCVKADGVITTKPNNKTFTEAAASVDGFLTALPFLRDAGNIQKGQKVLIYGASGSIGSAAVQLANYYGAEVTAVCSTANVGWVKELGAHRVIDYTQSDFREIGEQYDVMFDAIGKLTFFSCKSLLASQAIFLQAGISLSAVFEVLLTSIIGKKKVKIMATGLRPPKDRKNDLQLLKEMMEKGFFKEVIDRTFHFDEIVEAHRYVDQGRKKGNVAIQII